MIPLLILNDVTDSCSYSACLLFGAVGYAPDAVFCVEALIYIQWQSMHVLCRGCMSIRGLQPVTLLPSFNSHVFTFPLFSFFPFIPPPVPSAVAQSTVCTEVDNVAQKVRCRKVTGVVLCKVAEEWKKKRRSGRKKSPKAASVLATF